MPRLCRRDLRALFAQSDFPAASETARQRVLAAAVIHALDPRIDDGGPLRSFKPWSRLRVPLAACGFLVALVAGWVSLSPTQDPPTRITESLAPGGSQVPAMVDELAAIDARLANLRVDVARMASGHLAEAQQSNVLEFALLEKVRALSATVASEI